MGSSSVGVCFGLVLLVCGVAVAQDAPVATDAAPKQDNITMVEARQAMMQAMDDDLIVLEKLKEPDFFTELVSGAGISAMLLAETFMFPPDTDPATHPEITSAAKPEVWSDHEEFLRSLADVRTIAEELATAVSADDMAGTAARLRQACSSCHDRYLNY